MSSQWKSVVDGRKRCTRCGEWKSTDDFYHTRTRGRLYLVSHCKACNSIKCREERDRRLGNYGKTHHRCANCEAVKKIEDFPPPKTNKRRKANALCNDCIGSNRRAFRNKYKKDGTRRKVAKAYRQTVHGRTKLAIQEIRQRAAKRGLEFSLTEEWIRERLESGKCELTGIEFDLNTKRPFSPSVDRTDSTKGYTPDNCRMVVLCYNLAKNEATDDDVLEMAKALVFANMRRKQT